MKKIASTSIPPLEDSVVYKKIEGIDNYNKTIRCTYFLIVLFTAGSGTHYIDNVSFPIASKQLHLLFPGQHHHWITGSETYAHKIIIGKKIFETFSSTDEFTFLRHNLNPIFKLSDELYERVSNVIAGLESDVAFSNKNEEWKKIIQLRMDILASMMRIEVTSLFNEKLIMQDNMITKAFWDLIDKHLGEKRPVNWYAAKLAVSPNYLNRLCKTQAGMTAINLIHHKVMHEAKRQLISTKDPIKKIAYTLGFESTAAFSTFFKKNSGFSPSDYRK